MHTLTHLFAESLGMASLRTFAQKGEQSLHYFYDRKEFCDSGTTFPMLGSFSKQTQGDRGHVSCDMIVTKSPEPGASRYANS